MKNILIGGAWPYANGSLHIGHIAGLLPGDVIARYYRAKGDNVIYVSGSDCHGTPVTIRAKQENKTPNEVCDAYHDEFTQVFQKLGFSYDIYGKTTEKWHKDFVCDFHIKLYKSKYIYEKEVLQAICPTCSKSLTDRLIIGICPFCKNKTRADQCDTCGSILDLENIEEPKCSECQTPLVFHPSTQLYIAISKLENELTEYLESHKHWRKNAIAFTKRYIDEGLRDRAITRDIDWGIFVPKEGYEDKKIYIWAENVLGYLSASKQAAKKKNIPFSLLWKSNARHYYIHGKDNIPFHTIILPSLLIANGEGWHLPDDIISSEYLTLEGRKISTSQNWAIWAKDITDRYNPDALRYFFIANGPEKRDTDFSWREFVERNNTELLGAYGNLVNRTLTFISKYKNSTIPNGNIDNTIINTIKDTYDSTGRYIEEGRLKEALESIFLLVRYGNKYFDTNEPWKTRINESEKCDEALYNCVLIIANLSILLFPFLPFSSEKIFTWLGISQNWETTIVPAGQTILDISILFERIDKSIIDYESAKLANNEH